MQKAFSSGAQYISTDFPSINNKDSNYSVKWPKRGIGRLNPLFSHSKKMHGTVLEQENFRKLVRVFELKIP